MKKVGITEHSLSNELKRHTKVATPISWNEIIHLALNACDTASFKELIVPAKQDGLNKLAELQSRRQQEPKNPALDQAIEAINAKIRSFENPIQDVWIHLICNKFLKLCESIGHPLRILHEEPHFFNGCHWEKLSFKNMDEAFQFAAERLHFDHLRSATASFRKKISEQFLYEFPIHQKKQWNSSWPIFNLMNGTLSWEKGIQLKPFNPDDGFNYQLHYSYDPNATCPKFQHYLNRVLPNHEVQKLVAQYLAYVLIPNSVLKLEKVMILYGDGHNGKSVLFEIITELLGTNNCTQYSLAQLTDNGGAARLQIGGKLLNYCSEISSSFNSTIFKTLASGEPIESRALYKDPIILRDYARLMFNTNTLPYHLEFNEGFFRRFITIQFKERVTSEEKNVNLANEIIHDELPGILNWILKELPGLLSAQRFSIPEDVEKEMSDWREQGDSVQLFLNEGSHTADDGNGHGISLNAENPVTISQAYRQYVRFCKTNNLKECGRKTFSDAMVAKGAKKQRKAVGMVFFLEDRTPPTEESLF